MTSGSNSTSIPGLSTKTPFTVLAVKRSEIFANITAAKATAALRRKSVIDFNWPSNIGRNLSVMHDGGFLYYVTWPDSLDGDVVDLELTGHKDYPKAKKNAIHKFINQDLNPSVVDYDLNIGLTIDQFVVGLF